MLVLDRVIVATYDIFMRNTGFVEPVASGAGNFHLVSDALVVNGWGVFDGMVDDDLVDALRSEAILFWERDQYREAHVGGAAVHDRRSEIRSDHILWLDESRATATQFRWLRWMETLRSELNRDLFLGAGVYEGHLAMYPEGSFYRQHLDQHAGSDRRLLTVILYLNPDWMPGDGGELRLSVELGIKLDDGVQFVEIQPLAGRVVVFLSDKFWHEVLVTTKARMAITGWLQTN